MPSTCGCGRPDGPARSRPRSRLSPNYQRNDAWTWEHMALTRARVASASSPALAAAVEAVIREVLCSPRDAEMVAGDVVEMRRAIAAEKGDRARWDLKNAAGGLVDIEFIAQYLQLVHAASAARDPRSPRPGACSNEAARLGILGVEDAEVLRPAERLYQDLAPDSAALPHRAVRSEVRRRRPAEPARPRRRRAGLRRPRGPSRGDAGARAQVLRAHPRQRAVMISASKQGE